MDKTDPDRWKTASGWTLIHDFMHGWGIVEKVEPWPRTIYSYDLEEGYNLQDITVEQIEMCWPAIQQKREAQAKRIAAMPPIKFETFTFPKINAPYPNLDL